MSLIPFGFWAASGAGSFSYWLALLTGTGSEFINKIAVNSSNQIFIAGASDTSPAVGSDAFSAMFDTDGVLQFQKLLGGSGYESSRGVGVDSSGNAYFAGNQSSSGFGGNDILLHKRNSAGVLQWQKGAGTSGSDQGWGIAVDSSDNVYALGGSAYDSSPVFLPGVIVKYTSAGAFDFDRALTTTTKYNFTHIRDGVTNSSDDLFVIGDYDVGDGIGREVLVAKYNDSGTLSWVRNIETRSDADAISIDSSSNVYAVGRIINAAPNFDAMLLKFNTSGTLQWDVYATSASSNDRFKDVCTDTSGNSYVVGDTSSATQVAIIAKFNSSGTVIWQRSLSTAYNVNGRGINFDDDGNLVITGDYRNASNNREMFVIKLPADGSLTGTYSLNSLDWVYAAGSLTFGTLSRSSSTPSISSYSSILSTNTPTLTDATSTLTDTKVDLL